MAPMLATHDLMSIEEYLEGEPHSEIRHEYIGGQVYAMGGASRVHGLIVNALAFALTPAARRLGCQLFTSDMKVRLDITDKTVFYYPDLLLTCDQDDRHPHYVSQPCLIVEVLSDSTERIDRREKLLAYQTLPSLREYLLVAQDIKQVEVYRRSHGWLPDYVQGGAVRLDCLETEVAVADIYADVEFEPRVQRDWRDWRR